MLIFLIYIYMVSYLHPMTCTERNITKLLEYKNITVHIVLYNISQVLGMQYFRDENTYTLGTEYFVIDIDTVLKLVFVDEKVQDIFAYVEYYFDHFYRAKNYVMFYKLLRFFINYHSKKSYCISKVHENNHMPDMCTCLSTYEYCDIYNMPLLKSGLVFNIFTHRYEYHSKSNIFSVVPEHLYAQNYDITDLSECYSIHLITVNVLKHFPNSFYKCRLDEGEILVDKSYRVHVNNKYNKMLSFLFKGGKDLFTCCKKLTRIASI